MEVLIFLGVVLAVVFFAITVSAINNQINRKVETNSLYVKQIKDINLKYLFRKISKETEKKTFFLNTKRAFDNFDLDKHANNLIRDNLSHYLQIIQSVDYNINLFDEYKEELNKVPLTSDEMIAKKSKISLKSFNKREKKLGDKIVKNPQMNYSLRICWEYTSPAGRNHYSKYYIVSFKEIKKLVGYYDVISANSVIQNFKSKQTNPVSHQTQESRAYTNDDIEDAE